MSPPSPPGDFSARTLPVIDVQVGAILFRFYSLANEPIYYDPGSGSRLNAPDGAYGVLYCAEHPSGAFAETFLRQPGRSLIPADMISARGMVRLITTKPLRLAMLHGAGLARLGATAEVTHGGAPYGYAQTWSNAIHDHSDQVDGIAYTARHNDQQVCYAIFSRAQNSIAEDSRETDLDQNWFFEIAEEYGVGLSLF